MVQSPTNLVGINSDQSRASPPACFKTNPSHLIYMYTHTTNQHKKNFSKQPTENQHFTPLQ